MKNMKVSVKLRLSFLIMIFLVFIIIAGGMYGLFRMGGIATDMYENKALPLGDLATATEYFQRLRVQTRNAIIYTGNTEQLATVETDMNHRMEQFKASMRAYEPTISTDTGRQLYDKITKQYNEVFEPGIKAVLDGAKRGETIQKLLEEMALTTVAANTIADSLAQLTQARMEVMESANEEGIGVQGFIVFCDILVIAAVIIIALTLSFYISAIISKPLIFLTSVMQKMGLTGNTSLSREDEKIMEDYAKYKDETGQCIGAVESFLKHINTISGKIGAVANGELTIDVTPISGEDTMGISVKKMVDGLNDLFGEINLATTQVASASKQVADGSQVLAQGSTEQAAAVEQLSSSLSEITEKTKTNAEMASRAAGLAGTIMQNAEKGSVQMSNMMDAVKEINEASQSINKVIKVIDDIAFQTNILALNAAVEAARAGQHGKGFAVVAEEVRNLAAKSAEAAKDTGGLIANSMEKAELGSRIADETAASLEQIVAGISESSRLVGQIAKSSDEQAEGISQLNKGIDQVASVIQQNSATAEESSAASEEMSGQAITLEGLIARFKLKNDNRAKLRQPVMSLNTDRFYAEDDDAFGKY